MYLSKKRHKAISLIFSTWYRPKVQSPTLKHHQQSSHTSKCTLHHLPSITVVELIPSCSLSLNQSTKHAIWKSSFSVECLSSFWPVPNPTAPLMSWQLCPFKHTTPFTTIEGLSEPLTAGQKNRRHSALLKLTHTHTHTHTQTQRTVTVLHNRTHIEQQMPHSATYAHSTPVGRKISVTPSRCQTLTSTEMFVKKNHSQISQKQSKVTKNVTFKN